MAQKRYDDSRNWYAITTLAGYEDKVAENLRQRIQGVDMADKIFDTLVPKEKQIEVSALERLRKIQETIINIKNKFGKNSLLRGLNFDEGSTAKERNKQIGGHKA